MLEGAILSMAFFRSSNTPPSYSIVVTAPVDPLQKIIAVPFWTLDLPTIADTGEVMSWISQNPLVDKEMASEKTMVYLLAISHRG